MAEEYPVAPARMASLREKNGSSEKEKKKGWFGKNKGVFPYLGAVLILRKVMGCAVCMEWWF